MPHLDQVVGFGPYLYDLELGRLQCGEHVIRLPEQTARLLTCLIRKSGRLATRQELRYELWPDAPPSDTEQAINKRISQLRTFLSDNAEKPLYIETIPQRGYRFCAELHSVGIASPQQAPPATPVVALPIGPLPTAPSVLAIAAVQARSSSPRIPWWPPLAFLGVLAAAGIFLFIRYRKSATPASQALVIAAFAPFESTSPQAKEAATILRSDLIDRLAASPQLRVISANSSSGLRADSTLPGQASKLGLNLVIFGYLSSQGDTFNLHLELVRPSDSTHIASFSYSANMEGLSIVRIQATNDILDRMKLETSNGPDLGGTANPRAFEVYMHGRYHSSRLTEAEAQLALADYRQAVQFDPQFGNAYISLAQTYILLASRNLLTQQEGFTGAQDAVDHALRISPSLAAAHVERSRLFLDRDWNFPAAIQEATFATQLQSGSGGTHANLAWVLAVSGDDSAASEQLALARLIDPFNPGLDYIEMYIDFGLHDCSRILALSDKLSNALANQPTALNLAAWGKWTCGHQQQAIALWRNEADLYGDSRWAALENKGIQIWQAHGDKAYARLLLQALQAHALSPNFDHNFDEAEWAALAGEDQLALSLVSGRIARHESEFLTALLSPALAPLRQTPQFQSLLRSAIPKAA